MIRLLNSLSEILQTLARVSQDQLLHVIKQYSVPPLLTEGGSDINCTPYDMKGNPFTGTGTENTHSNLYVKYA